MKIFIFLAFLSLIVPSYCYADNTLHLNESAQLSTADFQKSVGVNIHSTYGNSNPYNYGDPALVEKALKYAGIRYVRDGISSGWASKNWAYTAVVQKQLGADGFKFNFAMGSVDPVPLASLNAFATAYPGAVASVEGPNEINKWSVATAFAFQKTLHDYVRSAASLKDAPVLDFTLAYASPAVYRPFGDVSALAEEGNAHIYAGSSPPLSDWASMLSASRLATPTEPVVVTETGYTTLTTFAGGVDESTQAKYILDALMDAAKSGVSRTYLYELLDRKIADARSPKEGFYGLFHANGQAKPAARALHYLSNALYWGQENVTALEHLQVTIDTTTSNYHYLLLQKAHKRFALVLWTEPHLWNSVTHEPLPAAAPLQATLTFPNPSANVTPVGIVRVWDPLSSDHPIYTAQNVSRVIVPLTDHPVVVDITMR